LDLKNSDAHQILMDLINSADIFITNMPFPIRKKLKITAEDVCIDNEELIYASLTGYGEVGPDADRTAYDSMAWWARSGLMDFVRPSSSSSVAWSTPGMGDHPTGVALFGAIMTALYRRQKTGKGGEVSTSLMANGAWSNGVFIQAALMDVEFPDRSEPLPKHPFYDFYKTKDGREFALGLINAAREWPKLATALDREDLLTDQRFIDEGLVENVDDLRKELSLGFSDKTLDEVNELLRNSGVTYGVLGKTTDHKKDPQFIETETLVKLEHEGFEDLLTINSPITIKDEKKKEAYRAPTIGEHTREILDEMGIDKATQNKLHDEGAIFWS
jgi:formyl-CoA transferase